MSVLVRDQASRYSSVVERPRVFRWIVGSILHELFLVSARVTKAVVGYVLSCLQDGAYKITLAVNLKEYPIWR